MSEGSSGARAMAASAPSLLLCAPSDVLRNVLGMCVPLSRAAARRGASVPWSLSSLRAATGPFARPRRGVGDVLRKRGSWRALMCVWVCVCVCVVCVVRVRRVCRRRVRRTVRLPGLFAAQQIATCGKSEEELKEDGTEYSVGTFPFSANSRARATGNSEGLVKIISHKETDRCVSSDKSPSTSSRAAPLVPSRGQPPPRRSGADLRAALSVPSCGRPRAPLRGPSRLAPPHTRSLGSRGSGHRRGAGQAPVRRRPEAREAGAARAVSLVVSRVSRSSLPLSSSNGAMAADDSLSSAMGSLSRGASLFSVRSVFRRLRRSFPP